MIPIIPVDDAVPPNPDAPRIGEKTLSGLKNPPPLALYIHIPWCVRKCPYCDFNSHELKDNLAESQYIDALIADLEQAMPSIWGRKLRSIFIGGGTPSLFSAAAIDRLLAHVRMLVPLEYDAEITLEANPGTVDAEHFSGYRDAGVNRLSLGIQSFNPEHLQALGRVHDREQAIQAAELALKTFARVNLDVMYALPQQTLQQALQDAQLACDLKPEHLSFYHLTLEPNTAFHRNPPSLPDDDLSASMQEEIEALLKQHGYQHYETSAFAQPGKLCRHNINYWTFGDYLGIGAGAHSKLSFHDRIIRQTRHKHPNRYLSHALEGNAVDAEWGIEDLSFEFMMNGLRLVDGFDLNLYEQRTGLPITRVWDKLNIAKQKGLIDLTVSAEQRMVKPTLLGQRFLNELLQIFL
ncbi:MAG: oxygen-independent coproporphyrinogen III oxidase-like protein [Candidatus Methylopumilus sp.]|mgnify:CR=1 FL=1|jgi:putative oxygen-independent coproporphyrinogen III oxidase|nr:oxygen-independent coproporphyrinogen III oxidase-like protein [Candidatus Methylopumilus sp.]NBW60525.1 oxygen-independent coproporphyrinogen III oxidase-like protein [Methylophilaceae bacterium]